jgi:hypothetical protein
VSDTSFPWRPLGQLLLQHGVIAEDQLEQALAEQRRSGRMLGEILVESSFASANELAAALAEQHGIQVVGWRRNAPPKPSDSGPQPPAARPPGRGWRSLGRLLVDKGLLSEIQLGRALEAQQASGRMLGELLVERGYVSASTLTEALAEQHGIAVGLQEQLEASLRPPVEHTGDQPVYEIWQPGEASAPLYSSLSFLDATDFAFDHLEERAPDTLVIICVKGQERDVVWSYDRERAAEHSENRADLVDVFGFPVARWKAGKNFDGPVQAA